MQNQASISDLHCGAMAELLSVVKQRLGSDSDLFTDTELKGMRGVLWERGFRNSSLLDEPLVTLDVLVNAGIFPGVATKLKGVWVACILCILILC